jgi:hypothetical protein
VPPKNNRGPRSGPPGVRDGRAPRGRPEGLGPRLFVGVTPNPEGGGATTKKDGARARSLNFNPEGCN